MRRANTDLHAYALMACAALLWAGNIVAGRAASVAVPPVGLSFWRWMVALILFAPFVAPLLRRQWPELRREWRLILLLALTGITMFHTFMYIAVNTTTALNASVIYAATPALVPLIARPVLGERLGVRQALGIGLSMLGIAIVVTRADPAVIGTLRFTRGDLWMIAAVVAWSLYSVLVKRRPADLHPNAMLAGAMAVGIALTLPFYLWETLTVRAMPLNATALWTVGYVAVFASIVAYLCYNRGIELVGPSRAALTAHMLPVFAGGLSVLFLGESLHLYHLAGAAAVVGGIALTGGPTGSARTT
jgi:drug/metabolite transporter (DMT)-like permease